MDDDVSSPVWLFQVSTLYTGKVFESNLEEAPLRFRLGKKYFRYLSLYSEEELKKEDVPKNLWLVYEVDAVKVK
ncbi:hypothetical protein IGI04_018753 [Brassica rapa subsp. trilocularis]|uniref:Uncharacterized protein n=1 Tax=Brassica rapa subsp. trilocularis TaxID=1813537 RepID=A0ABQ7MDV0_BRACM|nr:hypothetical protein IGI04_018749 [Brassica rapa subsp. trilocularis]KAG5396939.1 hypothetical protein IGI04_018753 [Brassica rapa subsp. trilocularis]